jgi:hypothetical protein
METKERTAMITGLIRALVRHRISDTQCLMTVEEIDNITTDQDRAFMLRLLRLAEPLYPLPMPLWAGDNDDR